MSKSLKEGKIGPNWLLRRSDWLFNINVRFPVQPSIFIYFWRNFFPCSASGIYMRICFSNRSQFQGQCRILFPPIFRRFPTVSVYSSSCCFALHFRGPSLHIFPPLNCSTLLCVGHLLFLQASPGCSASRLVRASGRTGSWVSAWGESALLYTYQMFYSRHNL